MTFAAASCVPASGAATSPGAAAPGPFFGCRLSSRAGQLRAGARWRPKPRQHFRRTTVKLKSVDAPTAGGGRQTRQPICEARQ